MQLSTLPRLQTNPRYEKQIAGLIFGLVTLAVTWALYHFAGSADGVGFDFRASFRPAALDLLAGNNPYTSNPVFNPPWALAPLIPIALLPYPLGASIMVVLNLCAYGTAAFRIGCKPWALALLLTCPLVLKSAFTGNLDALVALGFTLPPQIGLFFVLIKPQLGAAVAVFWLIQTYRAHGLAGLLRTFAPAGAAYLLSFLVFGLYPLGGFGLASAEWNYSAWPYSLIVGLALLVAAVRRGDLRLAIFAGPTFSSYVSLPSWALGFIGLVDMPKEFIAAVCGSWLIFAAELLGFL